MQPSFLYFMIFQPFRAGVMTNIDKQDKQL